MLLRGNVLISSQSVSSTAFQQWTCIALHCMDVSQTAETQGVGTHLRDNSIHQRHFWTVEIIELLFPHPGCDSDWEMLFDPSEALHAQLSWIDHFLLLVLNMSYDNFTGWKNSLLFCFLADHSMLVFPNTDALLYICFHAIIHLNMHTWAFFLLDAASKHAAVGFFDCLRAEMEEFGISVSTVNPTFICSYHRQPTPGNWEASIWKCKFGWMKMRNIQQEGGFSRVNERKNNGNDRNDEQAWGAKEKRYWRGNISLVKREGTWNEATLCEKINTPGHQEWRWRRAWKVQRENCTALRLLLLLGRLFTSSKAFTSTL